jgi:hypothetical protein
MLKVTKGSMLTSWRSQLVGTHRRLRVCELSIRSEKPPVMPASKGDREAPKSRSGLLVRSTLASAVVLSRVRGWTRKCRAAAIDEIGPDLLDASRPTVSGCNLATASSFIVFSTSARLPFRLETAHTSMTHLGSRRIAQLQYFLQILSQGCATTAFVVASLVCCGRSGYLVKGNGDTSEGSGAWRSLSSARRSRAG